MPDFMLFKWKKKKKQSSKPLLCIITLSASDRSTLICAAFCCGEHGRNVLKFFLNAPSGVCPKTEHDMIPRRALAVEGLTALPFLITADGPWNGDRRQTSSGSHRSPPPHAAVTAHSQPIKMTSVTAPCLPKNHSQIAYRETEPLSFLRALPCSGRSRDAE